MQADWQIALCAGEPSGDLASCAVELPGDAPDWVQLMRPGAVQARDGRKWTLSDPDAVIAASNAWRGETDMAVDYDHQTLHVERNGLPAPAAGWVSAFESREGAIWGKVAWTDEAAAAIKARRYRYISPVFSHSADGEVRQIRLAGLTNSPALDLVALASTRRSPGGSMDESQIKALREALGLDDGADAAAVVAACAALAARAAQLPAIAKAAGLAEDADGDAVATAVAAARAQGEPDPGKYVPREQFDEVAQGLRALQDETAAAKAESAVDAAVADGRIAPAQREWALGYAKADPEGFAGYVAAAPRIVNPGGGGHRPPPDDADAPLSADEVAACRAAGITEEAYKKARKERIERRAARGGE